MESVLLSLSFLLVIAALVKFLILAFISFRQLSACSICLLSVSCKNVVIAAERIPITPMMNNTSMRVKAFFTVGNVVGKKSV